MKCIIHQVPSIKTVLQSQKVVLAPELAAKYEGMQKMYRACKDRNRHFSFTSNDLITFLSTKHERFFFIIKFNPFSDNYPLINGEECDKLRRTERKRRRRI